MYSLHNSTELQGHIIKEYANLEKAILILRNSLSTTGGNKEAGGHHPTGIEGICLSRKGS